MANRFTKVLPKQFVERLWLNDLENLKHINLEGLRFRIIDAKGQIVGRLASRIAVMLQGKDKPIWNPRKEVGDVVIVTNAAHVEFAGLKWRTKLYRWHSGYPGGLKTRTAREMWKSDPCRILFWAVKGMLPKNKLRNTRLMKLKLYPEKHHPFKDFELIPYKLPARKTVEKKTGWLMPEDFEPMNPVMYNLRMVTSKLKETHERPSIDFSDLLTQEERDYLAVAKQTTGTMPHLSSSSRLDSSKGLS